ncbi:MAG: glycosyltransferase family 2 protein [Bacteroidota bacterium]
MTPPQINIVIPLYNEEKVFDELQKRLTCFLDESDLSISVILVNDGSRDNTPHLMRTLSMQDSRFCSVFLSRNFGHQIALSAGLSQVNATEGVFILDGDLQDPPELLPKFYDYLRNGYDVIYAIRKKRKESFLKVWAYKLFYRFFKRVAYIELPLDSGDFSLLSRRVVDHINAMPERSRFLRGMRSWVGFKQVGVEYERKERFAGDSTYTFKQLLALALNGIFNFSEYPIKFISNMGLLAVGSSLVYFLIAVIKRFVFNDVPEGFTWMTPKKFFGKAARLDLDYAILPPLNPARIHAPQT